jgi:hypothetical protein
MELGDNTSQSSSKEQYGVQVARKRYVNLKI